MRTFLDMVCSSLVFEVLTTSRRGALFFSGSFVLRLLLGPWWWPIGAITIKLFFFLTVYGNYFLLRGMHLYLFSGCMLLRPCQAACKLLHPGRCSGRLCAIFHLWFTGGLTTGDNYSDFCSIFEGDALFPIEYRSEKSLFFLGQADFGHGAECV